MGKISQPNLNDAEVTDLIQCLKCVQEKLQKLLLQLDDLIPQEIGEENDD